MNVDKKYYYEFDEKSKILFKYYFGSINLKDITSSWEFAIKNKLIPNETKGFILDYRKATFNLNEDEHNSIADFYKQNIEIFGDYKIAIITLEPKDIVIPVLVKQKDDGYYSQPFSTVEAARNWILGFS